MNGGPSNRTIGIVILAAGESARMGQPKQLLPYVGTTLLRHTVEKALSIPDAWVIVVLGAFAEKIRPSLNGLPVTIVENPAWSSGMGSSLRTGLEAALFANSETAAAIFLLCDQPLVSTAILDALIQTHRETGATIVASEYGEILGVPALFHRSLFPELLGLSGGEGAKKIISRHRDKAIGIPFADGAVDIDTPGDYAGLHNPHLADYAPSNLNAVWRIREWG